MQTFGIQAHKMGKARMHKRDKLQIVPFTLVGLRQHSSYFQNYFHKLWGGGI